MKLRNKKTGEIGKLLGTERAAGLIIIDIDFHDGNPRAFDYTSLEQLNEDWEDYKPAEPLIKDEKVRKAVRVWAEVNKLEPDFEVRYSENTFSLISWQACIEFNTQIDGLEHGKKYTIAELCGEEEE